MIITEVGNTNSIDELQSDANKVRLLTRQCKSNQIDQAIVSNSKLYKKYINAKEKLKKLSPQQTPAVAWYFRGTKEIYITRERYYRNWIHSSWNWKLYLIDDLQRDANKVRVLKCQGKSDQINQTMLLNIKRYKNTGMININSEI